MLLLNIEHIRPHQKVPNCTLVSWNLHCFYPGQQRFFILSVDLRDLKLDLKSRSRSCSYHGYQVPCLFPKKITLKFTGYSPVRHLSASGCSPACTNTRPAAVGWNGMENCCCLMCSGHRWIEFIKQLINYCSLMFGRSWKPWYATPGTQLSRLSKVSYVQRQAFLFFSTVIGWTVFNVASASRLFACRTGRLIINKNTIGWSDNLGIHLI